MWYRLRDRDEEKVCKDFIQFQRKMRKCEISTRRNNDLSECSLSNQYIIITSILVYYIVFVYLNYVNYESNNIL